MLTMAKFVPQSPTPPWHAARHIGHCTVRVCDISRRAGKVLGGVGGTRATEAWTDAMPHRFAPGGVWSYRLPFVSLGQLLLYRYRGSQGERPHGALLYGESLAVFECTNSR